MRCTMNQIKLKCISAAVACAMTASALSGSLRVMDFDRRVRAAEAAPLLGDVNRDGKVSADDAQMALEAATEIIVGNEPDLDDEQKVAADIDYNHDVTPIDAQYILMYFLHESVMDDPISWYTLTGINPPAPAFGEKLSADEIKDMINAKDYSIATTDQPTETSMTGEMVKVFQNMTPTEAYTYLYNGMATEFYFGSRKGAVGTFEQNGGNDIDQASLLIAVLRNMGYEADYISAVVELTADQMTEITSTEDAEIAYKIFRDQAIEKAKTVDALRDDAGTLTGVDIEHTWVTAKLPSKYVNGDASDELVEVQLDTSFKKGYRLKRKESTESLLGTENMERLQQYIDTGSEDALTELAENLKECCGDLKLDEFYDLPEPVSFTNIPAAENHIIGEEPQIGSEYLKSRTDMVQISIGGIDILTITAPAAYGKQLVIQYDFDINFNDIKEYFLADAPETIFDITDFYTQMGVRVQPYVMLNGKAVARGNAVKMGAEQTLGITVITGGGQQKMKTTNMLSGSMYAITLDMQNISKDELYRAAQNYSFDGDGKNFRQRYNAQYMGAYLTLIGKRYMAEADIQKSNYADIYDIHPERYLSVCVSSFDLCVTEDSIGEMKVEECGTVGLDVKSDSYTSVSLKGSEDDVDRFLLNTGVYGSYLEGNVVKAATGIDSVSTMHLFDQAVEEGIEIITISKENEDYQSQLDLLAQNQIPELAVTDITEAVENGAEVWIPVQPMKAGEWSGSPYIVKSDSGYGFMLSDLTNGSKTKESATDQTVKQLFSGDDEFFKMWYEISLLVSIIAVAFLIVSAASGALFLESTIMILIKVISVGASLGISLDGFTEYSLGHQSNRDNWVQAGETIGDLLEKLFMIFVWF